LPVNLDERTYHAFAGDVRTALKGRLGRTAALSMKLRIIERVVASAIATIWVCFVL
jgi:hypothetical protein